MMKFITQIAVIIAALTAFVPTTTNAQTQTVGLFEYNSALTYPGYTLIAPSASSTTYLLDNCGEVVNKWESQYRTGTVAYLYPNGDLLRTGNDPMGVFDGGGQGGYVELFDWYGNLKWQWKYSTNTYQAHHDYEILSNGNILVLAWPAYDSLTAIAAGRDPSTIRDGRIWGERILEVRPIYPDSAEIVWEWNLWDHLVQDFDSTQSNYGAIADNPRKWNINYLGDAADGRDDWIHANAIHYNEALDQIVMSARTHSEIYIIDHSTTTAEAATDTGGVWGHGGDILWRWGNPEAYGRGTSADRMLYFQHDPNWIPTGYEDGDKIMIFNNGEPRGYSSVDVVAPEMDGQSNYILNPGQPFGPATLDWTYADSGNFFSAFISGATRQENGNTLICSGMQGRVFEIDANKDVVWDWVNPVCFFDTILAQGEVIPPQPFGLPGGGTANMVFRAYRYHTFYGDLNWLPMNPEGPIERNPWPSTCTTPIGVADPVNVSLEIYPNPAVNEVKVTVDGMDLNEMEIYSIWGEKLKTHRIEGETTVVSTADLAAGVYLLKVGNATRRLVVSH